MFLSAWGGLLRTGLYHSFNLAAARPRRRVRCSLSKAALALESRVLPAATPVGLPFEIDAASDVAVDADGNFVVTWQQTTADQNQSMIESDIMARLYHADGTPAGDAFLVNTVTANFQQNPAVAMNASGEFVISWSCQVGNYDDVEVHAQRFDAEGVAQGSEFRVDATDELGIVRIDLVVHDDGAFAITWDRYGGDNRSDVLVRRYDAAGVAQGNEVLVAPDNYFVANSSIAALPDNGIVLTWSNDGILFGRRFNEAGQELGSGFYVDSDYAFFASVAADATGDFVVTWMKDNYNASPPVRQIHARRFNADGVAQGEAFLVSEGLTNVISHPNVAMSAEGHFVMTWTVQNPDYTNHDVLARAFNSDGVPLGDEFFVDTDFEGNQWYSNVAMTPSGEFIITWRDSENGEVEAQRYLLNLSPTDVTLSPGSVAENSAAGTTVGTLSGVDADGDDTFVFELVSGDGDDDNAAFQIVGNQLQTNDVFDHETKTSYAIRVRATDLTGASVETTLTVQVTNVLEPQVITLAGDSVEENLPKDTLVGAFGLTDAPEGSIRYRLVSGTGGSGNGRFKIVGNQLRTNATFNAEGQSSYSVRVQATDADGNVTIQVFTIEVTDVNESPAALKLSSTSVSAGEPAGTSVGQFTATDVDAGATLTYSLVAGQGDSDNSRFSIVGNSLVTAAEFTGRPTYSIRVRVADEHGASVERVFRIRVTKATGASATSPLPAWINHLLGTGFSKWESILS